MGFPTPWGGAADAYGSIWNILQGLQGNRRFDEFQREQVDPYNRYLDTTAESLGSIGNTTGMAHDLYGRARGLAGGLSDQANIDTNRRYDQLGAAGQAGLGARGIGGSTVGPSIAYANERNRGAELRLNNDARINALLGVESTFGGGEIAANQAAADARLRAKQGNYLIAPNAPMPFQSSGR